MFGSVGMVNPNAISDISVDKLFGEYTYEIPGPNMDQSDISKLLIMYGGNGSGKTTILQLLYHILSPARKEGHRTYLARQSFRKIAVRLADGMSIVAERKGSELDGSFTWSISREEEVLAEVYLQANADKAIPGKLSDEVESKHDEVIAALTDRNIQLYFLSDDRKILGRTEDEDSEFAEYALVREEIGERVISTRRILRDKSHGLPLDEAIDDLVKWIRNQVFTASSLGETNVNTIYSEVIKSIAELPSSENTITHDSIKQLLDTMKNLAKKNQEFSDLGLLPPLNVEAIVTILKKPHTETEAIIYNILRPYVDGIKARFDALEEIKNLINTFIYNLNYFYVGKRARFDLSQGLRLTSHIGQDLSIGMLSSGEKQLLLLFCHTLVAREQSSIVIIDEPEISLNVTWQRQLIRALLECAAGSNFQLILATHSMELLTQHKQQVSKLINLAISA